MKHCAISETQSKHNFQAFFTVLVMVPDYSIWSHHPSLFYVDSVSQAMTRKLSVKDGSILPWDSIKYLKEQINGRSMA